MARHETRTKARTALKAWISASGYASKTRLAERLGVSRELVGQWVAGICRPGPVYREALELVTKIPAADWETTAERDERRQIMADAAKGAA